MPLPGTICWKSKKQYRCSVLLLLPFGVLGGVILHLTAPFTHEHYIRTYMHNLTHIYIYNIRNDQYCCDSIVIVFLPSRFLLETPSTITGINAVSGNAQARRWGQKVSSFFFLFWTISRLHYENFLQLKNLNLARRIHCANRSRNRKKNRTSINRVLWALLYPFRLSKNLLHCGFFKSLFYAYSPFNLCTLLSV